MAAVLVGVSSPANADPHNIGWVWTTTAPSGGAGFFDADLAGYPSVEKLTVCDNKTDGHGVIATLYYAYLDGEPYEFRDSVKDPSNDGTCEHIAYNMAGENYHVMIEVCEYWDTYIDHCAHDYGVA